MGGRMGREARSGEGARGTNAPKSVKNAYCKVP